MVINLEETNPDGWDQDTNPHAGESINDAIIYELHELPLRSARTAPIRREIISPSSKSTSRIVFAPS